MTSTPIAKVNTAFANVTSGGRSGKQESSEVDFGLFINQAVAVSQEPLETQTRTMSKNQSAADVDSVNKENYSSTKDKITKADSETIKTEKSFGETDDLKDKLEECQEKIKEGILENLNVSEEELELAMEVLGLQLVDLMQPENLTNLVAQLTGNVEPVGLLMDENFQQLFQTVEELTSSLAADLGVSLEELQQLLTNLQQNVSGEMAVSSEDIAQQVILSEDGAEQTGTTEVNYQQSASDAKASQTGQDNQGIQTTGETKSAEVVEETMGTLQEDDSEEVSKEVKSDKTIGDGVTTESVDSEEVMSVKTNLSEESSTESSDDTNDQSFNNLQNGNNVVGSRQNVVETMTQALGNSQTNVNAENILRQITDAIKVNISQETTSMELQLNPENLGKINLQVVAKNGVITAHLAAENEAVKAALENQVVQLRENFNNQGIKVEAIEVTIASHGFERNLEENQQNGAREDNRQNTGDRRRNLNLSDLEAIQGIMSEEENLAVKMMLQNGNTVDYSA